MHNATKRKMSDSDRPLSAYRSPELLHRCTTANVTVVISDESTISPGCSDCLYRFWSRWPVSAPSLIAAGQGYST